VIMRSRLTVARRPHSTTVLIVDDDSGARAAACRTVRLAGFDVREAGDGASALRILQQHPHEIWLVLAELTTPGMSGTELAQRLLAAPSPPHVLLMSECSRMELDRLVGVSPELSYLRKPLVPEQLAARVQELRERPA
jgi:two-component system cell cycle sensor histidine kinase/response regulator CckA